MLGDSGHNHVNEVSDFLYTDGLLPLFQHAECAVAGNTLDNEPNNTSIVMRIVYGETSFMFTGDAEREVEQARAGSKYTLESTVLKVGHHGSYSSTSYVFLRNVMPSYAVIPVGADNEYGHPTEEVLSRLRDADVTLFRTDLHLSQGCGNSSLCPGKPSQLRSHPQFAAAGF